MMSKQSKRSGDIVLGACRGSGPAAVCWPGSARAERLAPAEQAAEWIDVRRSPRLAIRSQGARPPGARRPFRAGACGRREAGPGGSFPPYRFGVTMKDRPHSPVDAMRALAAAEGRPHVAALRLRPETPRARVSVIRGAVGAAYFRRRILLKSRGLRLIELGSNVALRMRATDRGRNGVTGALCSRAKAASQAAEGFGGSRRRLMRQRTLFDRRGTTLRQSVSSQAPFPILQSAQSTCRLSSLSASSGWVCRGLI